MNWQMRWQGFKKLERKAGKNASALSARQLKGMRFLKRFTRDQRGVTAIEFGLLALPFFAIIGAILETALVMLVSQILESSVQDAARFIRTGQAHEANFTISEFRADLCDRTIGLFNCDAFRISVRTVTTFASASYTPPTDPLTGDWVTPEQYGHGTGGSIILINVHYKWPTLTSFLSFNLADQPDQTRLLTGVAIFRNEPFG